MLRAQVVSNNDVKLSGVDQEVQRLKEELAKKDTAFERMTETLNKGP